MIHKDGADFNYEKQKKFWLERWEKLNYRGKLSNTTGSITKKIVREFSKLEIKFDSFLELGCGLGRNIHFFHETFPKASYTGVDINPNLRKDISRCYPDVLKFSKIVTVDALAFLKKQKPSSFDVIFTYALLLHITEDVINSVVKSIERCANRAIVIFEREKVTKECFWRIPRNYEEYFSPPCILKKPYTESNTLWIFKK